MKKLILLAGAASLAGAAVPGLAQGKGEGRGKGQGAQAAHVERGGGGGGARNAERRAARGAERGPRQEQRGAERANRRAERAAPRAERGPQRQAHKQAERAERQLRRADRSGERQARAPRREAERSGAPGRRLVREERAQDRRIHRAQREARRDWAARRDRAGPALAPASGWYGTAVPVAVAGHGGCPPGLARKNAFCMPPGQLRKAQRIGERLPIAAVRYNIPDRYAYRFADDERWVHRWDSGTVYRVDRASGRLAGIVPVLGAGLAVGEPLPLGYEIYNLPVQYRGQYRDDDAWLYRYDDQAIYRVNRESMLVDGIVALLTGGGLGGLGNFAGGLGGLGGLAGGLGGLGALGALGIGDPLPAGYDVYNVPLEYRDAYRDDGDHLYRYADNQIYQVDPQTRLIEQVISLLG